MKLLINSADFLCVGGSSHQMVSNAYKRRQWASNQATSEPPQDAPTYQQYVCVKCGALEWKIIR